MKKVFQFSLLLASVALLTVSCGFEEDNIFDKSAAERLNAASDKYIDMFQASTGGWVIEYYPTNAIADVTGTGYLWMVKFNKDMSVNVGMNNYFSDNAYRECTSLWDVITDNGPVLTFNSQNPNIHAFSDPDVRQLPGSSTNVWGTGVGGDYEFVIVQAPTEENPYVMLKGKKRGTYNRMTQLPEGTDFAEYLADVAAFRAKYLGDAPNSNILNLAGTKYISSDPATGMFSLYPMGGDAITETSNHPFLVTKNDGKYYVRFRSAVDLAGEEAACQEFVYDEENDVFTGVDNPNCRMEGYPPLQFFDETLRGGTKWYVPKAGDMSEKFRTYINAVDEGFAAVKGKKKYTFVGMCFSYTPKTDKADAYYSCAAQYKTSGASATSNAAFSFGYTLGTDEVTYSYQDALDTASGNIAKTVTSIEDINKVLSQSFRIEPATTGFNLKTMKVTAVNDPDIWFVITQ